MAVLAESKHFNLWFGTRERMEFLPTPKRGADVSPAGWGDGGSYLNGGGYQLASFGSHKNYSFEWSGASSRQVAQKMKSYSDGSYGRGLIYFVDPLIYDMNVFPAMWADPSIGTGLEGSSLVYGVDPVRVATPSSSANNLPVASANYNLATVAPGWRGYEEAVFLPIPDGYTLALGSIHTQTGTGRVFYRLQDLNGNLGTISPLTPIAPTASALVNTSIPHTAASGVWVYVGKTAAGAGAVTLSALTGRLFLTVGESISRISSGPWIGGQGHSGCRFNGKPTYLNNTGADGGQVGFAATFREVGSWMYG